MVPEADEPTCRRWFAANRQRLRSPEAWHARHILIAADPAEPEERAGAEAPGRRHHRRIGTAPERFAELAAGSACTSRERMAISA